MDYLYSLGVIPLNARCPLIHILVVSSSLSVTDDPEEVAEEPEPVDLQVKHNVGVVSTEIGAKD